MVTGREALARIGVELPIEREIDLYKYVLARTGVAIPRRRICADHSCPWDAFVYAYFARGANSVWWASRGFGGKTFQAAVLADTIATTLRTPVNIMGGSKTQSQKVISYLHTFADDDSTPRGVSISTARLRRSRTVAPYWGRYEVSGLPASQKGARGPHVARWIGDEIDEMDPEVLDAGLGQTMSRPGIAVHNCFSSTYHNHNGSMRMILGRAADNGWPVFKWCYEETREANGGWLPEADIEGKQKTVSSYMWDVEYKLARPNPGGRAIDSAAVERAFSDAHGGSCDGLVDQTFIVSGEPVSYPTSYAHGADWAKKRDFTVIVTLRRISAGVYQMVAFHRTNRRPWPHMVGLLDERMERFGGVAAHDATGLGSVVDDLLRHSVEPITMVGRPRHDLLSEYLAAIEHGRIKFPMVRWMFEEHLEASVDDVYGPDEHCPDSIVAGALAYHAMRNATTGVSSSDIVVPVYTDGGTEWV